MLGVEFLAYDKLLVVFRRDALCCDWVYSFWSSTVRTLLKSDAVMYACC